MLKPGLSLLDVNYAKFGPIGAGSPRALYCFLGYIRQNCWLVPFQSLLVLYHAIVGSNSLRFLPRTFDFTSLVVL